MAKAVATSFALAVLAIVMAATFAPRSDAGAHAAGDNIACAPAYGLDPCALTIADGAIR